jgi:hypothetical protein
MTEIATMQPMHTADTITVSAVVPAPAAAPAPAAPTAPTAPTANEKTHSRRSFKDWLFATNEPTAVKILVSPFRWFAAAVLTVGAIIASAVVFVVIVPVAMIKIGLML